MKLRLDLTYDGAAFCGFQVQPNGVSVQEELCRALSILCGEGTTVSGCSRTDAGVHAKHFVCHVVPARSTAPDARFCKGLNALLPDAISVFRVSEASEDFHARYSATQKTYRYYILNRKTASPLAAGRLWHVPQTLDIEKMQAAATALVGTHDFRTFQAAGSKLSDTTRTVSACRVFLEEDILCLEISADGFLYRMVRNVAGTLVDIGRGTLTEPMTDILTAKDRARAGICAPPEGLYLWRVDYEERSAT